jgi:hypothetical protein
MKRTPENKAPADAEARKGAKPVICYPVDTLPMPDMVLYSAARNKMKLTEEVVVDMGVASQLNTSNNV